MNQIGFFGWAFVLSLLVGAVYLSGSFIMLEWWIWSWKVKRILIVAIIVISIIGMIVEES